MFSNISVSFLNLFLFFVILLLSFLFFFFGSVLWVLGPWFRGQRAGLTGNIRPQGILIRVQYPRSPYLKTKTQLYPTACKLHCWKLQAEQLVKEEHSSSHQKNLQDQIKEEEVGEIGSHQLQIGTCQGHLPSASAGIWASLVAQSVKNLPAVQETRIRSLGWEDPLEKEMATHSSILAWKISWTKDGRAWWAAVHWVTKSWA